jgi:hypothetical protein
MLATQRKGAYWYVYQRDLCNTDLTIHDPFVDSEIIDGPFDNAQEASQALLNATANGIE